MGNDLLNNVKKIHTTELGVYRIKRNLNLDEPDVVQWCCEKTMDSNSIIERVGKNWYVVNGNCKITINAYSFTIITAHLIKRQ